jgi:hypothetical protein
MDDYGINKGAIIDLITPVQICKISGRGKIPIRGE